MRVASMDVTYFRKRRPGPESLIEDTVSARICDVFPEDTGLHWAAGSVPVGAGMPDLVVVSYRPQVFALTSLPLVAERIIAYLRTVTGAHLQDITAGVRAPSKQIINVVQHLTSIQIVHAHEEHYHLADGWDDVLPEIITVEVKVADWKKAIQQASRNTIFAHRSFVAFPTQLAAKVALEPTVSQFGLGVIAVDDDDFSIIREAESTNPRVWSYYYRLASLLAKHQAPSICQCTR